jgi:hypothetical protein
MANAKKKLLNSEFWYFLLNFHWLGMVFNTCHHQDLYDTYMTGWLCLQKMEDNRYGNLMETVETECLLCKEKDIIRSE